ncbi:MAG: hypothetical protein PHG26_05115 [Dehalococcoidales bacterium]|nr:hypothetical protein [Dehalococcoidales bacterium]
MCENNSRQWQLPHVETLDEIQACLLQITWTRDSFWHLYDSISYPQTVWKKKKDDCDGFAVLAAALLNQWNPDTQPVLLTVIIRPIRSSHTVCVFKAPDGLMRYFDNARLITEDYHGFGQIARQISLPPKRMVCWDVRQWEDFSLIEFHQS